MNDESTAPLTVGVLKSLLEAQTTNFKNMEESLKKEIKRSEDEVKRHTEDQLLEVKSSISKLEENVVRNADSIKDLRKDNEREKRLRNLIIFKIPENETNRTQLITNINNLILESCKVDISNHIDRIHRIGKSNPAKVRPILLALTSFNKKMEILSGKKQHQAKLEISEDYAPDVLTTRRGLVPILKQLREIGYKDSHLKQDKLYVDGTECNEERLCKLISDKNKKTGGNDNILANSHCGGSAKRKTDRFSPNGNEKKRQHTPDLSDTDLHKPESSRNYLVYNKRPPASPFSNLIAQRAIDDISQRSNSETELNQTRR